MSNTILKGNNLIEFIQGIKALAALWIVWYHADQLLLPVNYARFDIGIIADLGFIGVNVFLLLSGFGLTLSAVKKQSKANLSWKQFFIKRAIRIYPLYIFAHILFLVLGAIVGKYSDMPFNTGLFLSITGFRVFFPNYFWYGPDAFWFVGLIIQFYLLFPLLFLLLNRISSTNFLLITFSLCFVSRYITFYSHNSYIFMMGLASNRLAEFSAGMALAFAIYAKKNRYEHFDTKRISFWLYLLVSMLLGTFIYYQMPANFAVKIVAQDLILAFAGLYFISLLVFLIKTNFWAYQKLIGLGNISYAIYLIHSPPIRPVFSIFNKIGINNFAVNLCLYLSIVCFFSFILVKLENHFASKLILHRKRLKTHSQSI